MSRRMPITLRKSPVADRNLTEEGI